MIIFSIIVCGSNLKDALAGIDPRGVPQRKIAAKTGRITRELIIEAQERLSKLGYWIAAAEGKWGDSSRHALIAFQKIEHRRPSGRLSMDEIRALRNASRPEARERGAAHIEVDLTRQVLMMVGGDGLVSKILPVSTGNGSSR